MTEEESLQRRKENQELREALGQTQEQLRAARTQIEELEKQKTPPSAFVRANVPKLATEEKKLRKKRKSQRTHARRRSQPTQIVEHHLTMCQDGNLHPGGISLARCRDVIDLPAPVAYPGVPSDTRVAARSVRPLIIARTISGGTCSPRGSSPRMGLASLFGTWMAHGLSPFHPCLALLTSKVSLGYV
jgi:hypothetical protein